MTLDDNGNPNGVRQDYTTHAESFKAGAKWQKQQTISKACKWIEEKAASDNLKEAADNALESITDQYDFISVGSCMEMFRLGAKWQKKQMMAKAVDGYVIEDVEEGNGDFLLSADYLPKTMGLKDQQRVKVIVIKKN
jgi:hypothetical protein